MSHRSLAEFGRSIGVSQVGVKLDTAAEGGRLPNLDLITRIIRATDITLGEIMAAGVRDAGFGELMPPVTREDAVLIRSLLGSPPETRRMVTAILAWVEAVDRRTGVETDPPDRSWPSNRIA